MGCSSGSGGSLTNLTEFTYSNFSNDSNSFYSKYYVMAKSYSDGLGGTITYPIIYVRSKSNKQIRIPNNTSNTYSVAYYNASTQQISSIDYSSVTVKQTLLNAIVPEINSKFGISLSADSNSQSLPSSVSYYITV